MGRLISLLKVFHGKMNYVWGEKNDTKIDSDIVNWCDMFGGDNLSTCQSKTQVG